MIYKWINKTTNEEIEVERKMKDSDIPPTKEELEAAGIKSDNKDIWEKVIIGGSFTQTWNMKGSW